MSNNQFQLLSLNRFLPLFLTQFLGALNDNIYKNAIVILVTFGIASTNYDSTTLVNLSAGLFILPFFLFSATAGQLADKFEKSKLVRIIKASEILIMLSGAIALYFGHVIFLLVVLFFMGAQSTFFGPIKYGILPQHLTEKEIVGGNALIEAGTFLAILIGTIIGGVLVTSGTNGKLLTGIIVVVVAILGFLTALRIPQATAVDAKMKLNWNLYTATTQIVKVASLDRAVFLSILGISWFWFFGAVVLAQLPLFTKDVLGGSEALVTFLLVVFSIGIGMGSLCCEKLANYRIELGLVPLGAFGLSLSALDLGLATIYMDSSVQHTVLEFLKTFNGWRVVIDITAVSFFGGIFIVPLYALVQERGDRQYLSRIIAANNILNAFFMVIASVFALLVLKFGFSIPQLFILLSVINAIVAVYIFKQVPEFAMRLIVWLLMHTIYRLQKQELEHIPEQGPAVIVANHVSFVDAMIILSASRRPIRFVMDHGIFKIPLLNFIFKTANAIPIASAKVAPEILDQAYNSIAKALENGELVGIFPEGKITYDGELNVFKPGIEKIIARTPVPVIPLALCGLYGSFFSRVGGKAMRLGSLPGRLFHKIAIKSSEAVMPNDVKAELLQAKVSELRGEWK